MTVSVRRAGPADAAALAAVAAETFALACPPGTAPESIAAFIAQNLSEERFGEYLADPHRDILLALDGHAPAGYTMLVFGVPHDEAVTAQLTHRPTAELSKVYVLGQHHGARVAAILMTATLEAARARGVEGVWLGVNQQNARAVRFYEKSGFARVGTKTFLVGGELHNDFVMEQAL